MASRAQIKDEAYVTLIPLKDAAREYVKHCRGNKMAPNTITAYKGALERLVDICPPGMMAHQLTPFYVTSTLRKSGQPESDRDFSRRLATNSSASRRTGRADSSLNIDRGCYRGFEEFLKGEHYISANSTVMKGLKNSSKRVDRSRRNAGRWYVPFDDRELLLKHLGDEHPRGRAIAAMGLWGGRRWSDMATMRIRDIDLDNETFSFINEKAGGVMSTLPMLWPEFVMEMRMWLAWLASQHGLLDPDWYLFPARLQTVEFTGVTARTEMCPEWPVDPTVSADYQSVRTGIRRGLELIGAPLGEKRINIHALRHSCAHWLLDHEGWRETDVAVWLDHDDPRTTISIYLADNETTTRLRDRYGNGPIDVDDRLSAKRAAGKKFRTGLEYEADREESAEGLHLAA